jgi:stringent starvation protein B
MADDPLPPKKDVALALLEGPSVFVHLDPRREGAVVPDWFKKQHQLVLQLGMNLAVRIPDLLVDDEGISCTLSFNRSPFWCSMPWTAIYALVGEDGRGMIWPEDVPSELVAQKPKLQVVGGKKSKRKRSADDQSGKARAGAPTLAAVPDPEESDASAGDDGIDDEDSELVDEASAASDDEAAIAAGDEAVATDAAVALAAVASDSGAASATADEAAGASDAPDDDDGAEAEAPPKGRALPPYLRVVK